MTLEQIVQAAIIGTNIEVVQIQPVKTYYDGKIMPPKVRVWYTKSPNRIMRLGKFLNKYTLLTQAEIHTIVEDYKHDVIKDYPPFKNGPLIALARGIK